MAWLGKFKGTLYKQNSPNQLLYASNYSTFAQISLDVENTIGEDVVYRAEGEDSNEVTIDMEEEANTREGDETMGL